MEDTKLTSFKAKIKTNKQYQKQNSNKSFYSLKTRKIFYNFNYSKIISWDHFLLQVLQLKI